MKNSTLLLAFILALAFICCTAQQPEGKPIQGHTEKSNVTQKGSITMATTTSTYDSGLLDYLNPIFTASTGIEVNVVSMGTGAALRAGENGDADLILVHDTEGEMKFVNEGFGVNRKDVFYNDFIILGPPDNPAQLMDGDSAPEAMAKIAEAGATFISRGDDSGTHRREQSLWQASGIPVVLSTQTIVKKGMETIVTSIKPEGDWYLSIGQGMGAALNMANEKNAYVLADRGTYLSYKADLDLVILSQGDPSLVNQYGIIAINPAVHHAIKFDLAMEYIEWLCSEGGQQAVGAYKKDGEVLFHPNCRAQ